MINYNIDTTKVNRLNNSEYEKSNGYSCRMSEEPIHPSHMQPRPEDIIDLEVTRTQDQKIKYIVGLAISMNLLKKTFVLKDEFSFAIPALEQFKLKYILESEKRSIKNPINQEELQMMLKRVEERIVRERAMFGHS